MPIKSPVTYSNNTNVVDQFEKNEIIDLYEKEGINVTRFFSDTEKIFLIRCEDTHYRFFYPSTIFGDDKFYQDLYKKISGYYHINRWEHKKAKKLLPVNCNLLEVGCGDGFFLNTVKSICKTTKGLELNTDAIISAREKGLDVEATTIQDFALNNSNLFDVVCCFQVLEHIYDIRSFVQSMINCLVPGGLMIIAVPNNNPYLFKREKKHFLNLPPHHAGLWNKGSLENLIKVFPLEIELIVYEPLVELKMWYKAQIAYYTQQRPLIAKVLKIFPRQVYKPVLKLFRKKIQGKTIMAIFKVRNHE